MTSGRDKGIAFERKMCVEFSKWWSGGEADDIFWRSNASGARATSRAKLGKRTPGQYGDICAIDPVGEPFLAMSPVELKRGYPKVSIHDMLDQLEGRKQVPAFAQWIQQAKDAANDSPKAIGWLLVTSRYSKRVLVWMPKNLRESLDQCGASLRGVRNCIRLRWRSEYVYGLPLDQFFESVQPKHYMKLSRTSPQELHNRGQRKKLIKTLNKVRDRKAQ